jgi:uncharacterized protein
MLVVQELWRYPVKSLGGEALPGGDLDELGVRGDRAWGIRDLATGLILTARREPALLMASAAYTGERPLITADTGEALTTDAALSEWIGRPVALVPASDGPGTFENPLDVEHETDWMRWDSAPGTFHDGRSRVSLVSTGSLADHDRRRFRINLVLSGDGEDDLVGADVTVGTARLHIRKPIDRCVMVNRAQPGLPADRDVLRRVIRERANLMGVGAVVTQPGSIAIGDAVTAA